MVIAFELKDAGYEGAVRGQTPKFLDAEVLPQRQILRCPQPHAPNYEEPCLVVEYTPDNSNEVTARMWLRERDGLVLQFFRSFFGKLAFFDLSP